RLMTRFPRYLSSSCAFSSMGGYPWLTLCWKQGETGTRMHLGACTIPSPLPVPARVPGQRQAQDSLCRPVEPHRAVPVKEEQLRLARSSRPSTGALALYYVMENRENQGEQDYATPQEPAVRRCSRPR